MFPKTVLVTGANRGIGFELVRQMAMSENSPTHIFATSRQPDKAEALKSLSQTHSNIHPVQMDIVDDKSIESCVQSVTSMLGVENTGLNLLINNAGILSLEGAHLPSLTRNSLLTHMDIHAAAPLLVSQAFLPLLKKAVAQYAKNTPMSIEQAAIVNISSGLGSIGENTSGQGISGYSYRLGKAALNMATKCLSIDLRNDNILCVAFCPGWVQTDLGGKNALLTPEASVSALLSTMSKLGPEHHGNYYHRTGDPIPY